MGQSGSLVEGIDYTIEAGRWVFTAKYLRERGYCCESGCRNCPYRNSGADDQNATQANDLAKDDGEGKPTPSGEPLPSNHEGPSCA